MVASYPEIGETPGMLLVVMDSTGSIRELNAAASALFAQAAADVRGRPLWTLPAIDTSAEALERAIRRCLATRDVQQVEVVCATEGTEKRFCLVSLSVAERRDGEPPALIASGVGITASVSARQTDIERLEALLEQAPDGIFVADLAGRYTDVNDAGCRILGCSREELLGKTILDLIPPEDAERLWATREQLLAGEMELGEWQLRHKDGHYVPVEVSARILPDGRWQGLVRDITVRRELANARTQVEQALRTSEERFRVSLQSAPVAVWNQDRELRYTWVHNVTRLSRSELLGKTDLDVLPPEDAERVIRIKRRVLETGVGERSVYQTTIDGEARFYDLTIEPLRDHANNMIGITCAAWNITDQKRAEERQLFLAEAGRVLLGTRLDVDELMIKVGELAVGSLADLFIVDVIEDGRWRRLHVRHGGDVDSRLVERLQRVDIDRARGALTSESLLHGGIKVVTSATAEDLRSVAPTEDHAALLRALRVHSFVSVPLSRRGEVFGAFAFVSTSPARQYREAEARFAEEFARVASLAIENAHLYRTSQRAISARDEVLGVVAHDLRGPINLVLLNVQLLAAYREDSENRTRSLEHIRHACDRMTRLARDILDVTRLEAGALELIRTPVVTLDLLADVVETHSRAAAEASIRLLAQFSDQVSDVLGDLDRLLQVFENLIGNAIKFTPAGGSITVGSETRDEDVVLWVADSGRGMSAEEAARVFDRFWQVSRRDRRGAGLGLSIVKGIVERLGGRIWVESALGSGSTFYFTVPRAKAAVSHLTAPHP